MQTRIFDEISIPLSAEDEEKVLTIRKYFEEMALLPDEVEKRIRFAYDMESLVMLVFAYLKELKTSGEQITDEELASLSDYAQSGYRGILEDNEMFRDTEYTNNRIAETILGIIAVTIANDSDYYTSVDRAIIVAETEANVIGNYNLNEEAKENGMTAKTWITMLDNKVRDTHQFVDGETIPIDEPFGVGESQLMYPCDTSLGASAEEIVNCRCVVEYS